MILRFLYVALAFALVLPGQGTIRAAGAPATATAPASQPARQDIPTFGISFIPPPASAGWTQEVCPDLTVIAHFTRRDPVTHQIVADISITADHKTLAAQDFITRLSGSDPTATVLTQSLEIDHLATVGLRKDQPDRIGRPYLLLLTQRASQHVVHFLARGLAGDSPNRELVDICKSVQWSPSRFSADHLEFSRESIPLFGDKGPSVRLPEVFRRDTQVRDGKLGAFVAADELTDKVVVALSFGLSDFPLKQYDETDPVRFLAAFARSVIGNAGGPGVFMPAIDRLPSPQSGAISEPFFNGREAIVPDSPRNQYRVGVVVHDKQAMTVMLTIFHQDAAAVDKCAAIFPQVLQSIHFPEAPASQPATTQSK